MLKSFIKAVLIGLIFCPPIYADSTHRNSIMGTGARRNTIEIEFVEPSAGSALNMVPGTDNTNALGTSSLRYSDVQTYDLTAADDVTVTDDLSVGDDLTLTGSKIYTFPSTTTITGSTTIAVSSSYIVIAGSASATLVSTPNIATSGVTAGTYIIVTSTSGVFTLQDQTTLASSGMSLGSATLTITTTTARSFIYNGTVWKHVN